MENLNGNADNGIHLGIIPDGSRRWAKKNGIRNYDGTKSGKVMAEIASHVFNNHPNVSELTIWAMSPENLKRPEKDRKIVYRLLENQMKELFNNPLIHEQNLKVNVVGQRLEEFPPEVNKIARELMAMTRNYSRKTMNICVGYGGKEEIINAVMGLTKWLRKNNAIAKLHKNMFERHLLIPRPLDMVIRTGGEKRLSGFMLYQIEYAELFFVDTLWPDFTTNDLDMLMKEFSERHRRFGR